MNTAELVGLLLAGACIGSLLNLVIYRLCWNVRTISPWTPGLGSELGWLDRLPIVGWLSLRRREAEHGRGFWIRPLLIELLTAASFVALYWWEVDQMGLLSARGFREAFLPDGVWPCPGGLSVSLLLTLESHLILLCLMIAASFIDIDDRIIPDTITVPGTLAGLLLAAVVPWSLLPNLWFMVGAGGAPIIDFQKLSSPEFWPNGLAGFPSKLSLAIGLACYWGWCFALLPRPWRTRHGLGRALRILTARIAREPVSLAILVMGVVGSAAIALVWWLGDAQWAGLLSALVGMAASGGLVWAVRIIGTVVLGREAMGFGDVTLMAMVGTFIGWQASLIVFFVAPFFALLIGVGYWVLRRDPEIPYGPFLCLGTLAVIVRWSSLWEWVQPMFAMGWLVPVVMVACMLLMAILLGGLRVLQGLFRRDSGSSD